MPFSFVPVLFPNPAFLVVKSAVYGYTYRLTDGFAGVVTSTVSTTSESAAVGLSVVSVFFVEQFVRLIVRSRR